MSSHIIERAEMLSGQPAARVVYFDEVAYNPPGGKYVGQLPSDLDGAAAGDPLGQMTQTEHGPADRGRGPLGRTPVTPMRDRAGCFPEGGAREKS
jgi:hypothetical protein